MADYGFGDLADNERIYDDHMTVSLHAIEVGTGSAEAAAGPLLADAGSVCARGPWLGAFTTTPSVSPFTRPRREASHFISKSLHCVA
jgi:hypothetical protein